MRLMQQNERSCKVQIVSGDQNRAASSRLPVCCHRSKAVYLEFQSMARGAFASSVLYPRWFARAKMGSFSYRIPLCARRNLVRSSNNAQREIPLSMMSLSNDHSLLHRQADFGPRPTSFAASIVLHCIVVARGPVRPCVQAASHQSDTDALFAPRARSALARSAGCARRCIARSMPVPTPAPGLASAASRFADPLAPIPNGAGRSGPANTHPARRSQTHQASREDSHSSGGHLVAEQGAGQNHRSATA